MMSKVVLKAILFPKMTFYYKICIYYSGLDENAVGAFAQLVFSPFDESFAESVTLLPSGFRVIPLDPKTVGLDMLETTLVALQDIMLDKILNEARRKTLCSEFSKTMQQGFVCPAWADTAIKRAYHATDKEILDKAVHLGRGGSTAVTAILIDGQKLVVANVGDARAVICKSGMAKQLSVDHKPSKEQQNIESRGGFVSNIHEPKPPCLETLLQARPPKVKSSQELEQEELEKIPKFKARPLNKRIFESKGDSGIFCNPKRQATRPQEFHFVTDERIPPSKSVTGHFDKLSLHSLLSTCIPRSSYDLVTDH
ncbi:hypothetical protein IFM89_003851 [Coptis chinensis]|uniref:PPM-type phosphatase domain-containing protein n=1 Tax=Coptis chinensis TaxID=261450 RepID=A0A835M253_9MAGN|nr:hypothetical protein IFM89_003851 [Coptis chinensis]